MSKQGFTLMKYLELKFNIPGISDVTSSTKDTIIGEFPILTQHRLKEIWEGHVPPREKVSIEAQGCCVSIMDDWECTIFGKSFIDCLVVLSLVHEFLNKHFNKPVGFQVLYPSGKSQTVDSMIAHERRKARLITIGKFIFTALISGLIGYYLNLLIGLLGR
jgi:hypothetical protein